MKKILLSYAQARAFIKSFGVDDLPEYKELAEMFPEYLPQSVEHYYRYHKTWRGSLHFFSRQAFTTGRQSEYLEKFGTIANFALHCRSLNIFCPKDYQMARKNGVALPKTPEITFKADWPGYKKFWELARGEKRPKYLSCRKFMVDVRSYKLKEINNSIYQKLRKKEGKQHLWHYDPESYFGSIFPGIHTLVPRTLKEVIRITPGGNKVIAIPYDKLRLMLKKAGVLDITDYTVWQKTVCPQAPPQPPHTYGDAWKGWWHVCGFESKLENLTARRLWRESKRKKKKPRKSPVKYLPPVPEKIGLAELLLAVSELGLISRSQYEMEQFKRIQTWPLNPIKFYGDPSLQEWYQVFGFASKNEMLIAQKERRMKKVASI